MKFRFGLVCLVVMLLTGTFSLDTYASDETVCSVSLLHTHSGSSSSGGGCYTTPSYKTVRERNVPTTYTSCSCGGTLSHYNYKCDICGATFNDAGLECNKCGVKKKVSINHSHTVVSGYSLGCGLSENQVVGTVSVTKQVNSSYTLTPQLTDSSSGASITSYSWSNGDTGTCTVTGDGTYTCTVTWTDNGAVRTSSVSYVVEDYDKEPPVVNSITESPEARTKEDVVLTIRASDNMGIDSYSFDSKGTWQSGNTLTISSNGKVGCAVKDLAGNMSDVVEFTISNIDKESPVVDEVDCETD